MKHPALARVFSVILAIMSVLTFFAGIKGFGDTADSNKKSLAEADRLEKQPEWADSKYVCFELAVEIDHGVYNSITYKVRDGALVEWKRGIKDIFNGTSMNSKLVKGAK